MGNKVLGWIMQYNDLSVFRKFTDKFKKYISTRKKNLDELDNQLAAIPTFFETLGLKLDNIIYAEKLNLDLKEKDHPLFSGTGISIYDKWPSRSIVFNKVVNRNEDVLFLEDRLPKILEFNFMQNNKQKVKNYKPGSTDFETSGNFNRMYDESVENDRSGNSKYFFEPIAFYSDFYIVEDGRAKLEQISEKSDSFFNYIDENIEPVFKEGVKNINNFKYSLSIDTSNSKDNALISSFKLKDEHLVLVQYETLSDLNNKIKFSKVFLDYVSKNITHKVPEKLKKDFDDMFYLFSRVKDNLKGKDYVNEVNSIIKNVKNPALNYVLKDIKTFVSKMKEKILYDRFSVLLTISEQDDFLSKMNNSMDYFIQDLKEFDSDLSSGLSRLKEVPDLYKIEKLNLSNIVTPLIKYLKENNKNIINNFKEIEKQKEDKKMFLNQIAFNLFMLEDFFHEKLMIQV